MYTELPKYSWEEYDLILIPGGDNLQLRDYFIKNNFKVSELKKDVIVIGDSAGAYTMSAYYSKSHKAEDGFSASEAFFPESKLITLAHVDNSRYVPEKLIDKLKEFAEEKGLEVLLLKENEEIEREY